MNLIQFPTRSFGNKGQKILRAQKIHKKEKETTSIVATHLLTFHFTRNQYSPNISAKSTKEQRFKGCRTRGFFLSLLQGIKQTLSLCLPVYSEKYLSKKSRNLSPGSLLKEDSGWTENQEEHFEQCRQRCKAAAVLPNIIFTSVCLLSLTINILLCSPSISLQFKQGVSNGVWSSRSLLESCL